jgi:hypothetical protein
MPMPLSLRYLNIKSLKRFLNASGNGSLGANWSGSSSCCNSQVAKAKAAYIYIYVGKNNVNEPEHNFQIASIMAKIPVAAAEVMFAVSSWMALRQGGLFPWDVVKPKEPR